MTMGPEPRTRIFEMSVRLGIADQLSVVSGQVSVALQGSECSALTCTDTVLNKPRITISSLMFH